MTVASTLSQESPSAASSSSRKMEDESWRKPGKQFRANLLNLDAKNTFQLKTDCAIERYYQVADRVMQQFLQHPIDERNELIESYLIGSRLIHFLSSILPTHPQFFEDRPSSLRLLREQAQQQLVELTGYIDVIAKMLDRQEHERYISYVLGDNNPQPKQRIIHHSDRPPRPEQLSSTRRPNAGNYILNRQPLYEESTISTDVDALDEEDSQALEEYRSAQAQELDELSASMDSSSRHLLSTEHQHQPHQHHPPDLHQRYHPNHDDWDTAWIKQHSRRHAVLDQEASIVTEDDEADGDEISQSQSNGIGGYTKSEEMEDEDGEEEGTRATHDDSLPTCSESERYKQFDESPSSSQRKVPHPYQTSPRETATPTSYQRSQRLQPRMPTPEQSYRWEHQPPSRNSYRVPSSYGPNDTPPSRQSRQIEQIVMNSNNGVRHISDEMDRPDQYPWVEEPQLEVDGAHPRKRQEGSVPRKPTGRPSSSPKELSSSRRSDGGRENSFNRSNRARMPNNPPRRPPQYPEWNQSSSTQIGNRPENRRLSPDRDVLDDPDPEPQLVDNDDEDSQSSNPSYQDHPDEYNDIPCTTTSRESNCHVPRTTIDGAAVDEADSQRTAVRVSPSHAPNFNPQDATTRDSDQDPHDAEQLELDHFEQFDKSFPVIDPKETRSTRRQLVQSNPSPSTVAKGQSVRERTIRAPTPPRRGKGPTFGGNAPTPKSLGSRSFHSESPGIRGKEIRDRQRVDPKSILKTSACSPNESVPLPPSDHKSETEGDRGPSSTSIFGYNEPEPKFMVNIQVDGKEVAPRSVATANDSEAARSIPSHRQSSARASAERLEAIRTRPLAYQLRDFREDDQNMLRQGDSETNRHSKRSGELDGDLGHEYKVVSVDGANEVDHVAPADIAPPRKSGGNRMAPASDGKVYPSSAAPVEGYGVIMDTSFHSMENDSVLNGEVEQIIVHESMMRSKYETFDTRATSSDVVEVASTHSDPSKPDECGYESEDDEDSNLQYNVFDPFSDAEESDQLELTESRRRREVLIEAMRLEQLSLLQSSPPRAVDKRKLDPSPRDLLHQSQRKDSSLQQSRKSGSVPVDLDETVDDDDEPMSDNGGENTTNEHPSPQDSLRIRSVLVSDQSATMTARKTKIEQRIDEATKQRRVQNSPSSVLQPFTPRGGTSKSSGSSQGVFGEEDDDTEMVNAFLVQKRRPLSNFRGCVRCLLD